MSATGVAFGGIIAFNPDGSNAINLTANTFDQGAPEGQYKSSYPSVAANGMIAFQSNRDRSGYRIFLMNGDGSGLRQLTFSTGLSLPAWMEDLYPVISPDGSRVAFVSKRSDVEYTPGSGIYRGIRDIFIVNTDGTGLRQVTTSQINYGGGGAAALFAAWPGARIVPAWLSAGAGKLR